MRWIRLIIYICLLLILGTCKDGNIESRPPEFEQWEIITVMEHTFYNQVIHDPVIIWAFLTFGLMIITVKNN